MLASVWSKGLRRDDWVVWTGRELRDQMGEIESCTKIPVKPAAVPRINGNIRQQVTNEMDQSYVQKTDRNVPV